MSTYDAYTLSMRDSTEFTVPTGGSESSGRLDIFKIKIRITPFDSEPKSINVYFSADKIMVDDMMPAAYVDICQSGGYNNPTFSISCDCEWHEMEVVSIDGTAAIAFSVAGNSRGVFDKLEISSVTDTIDATHFNENEQIPYFIATGDGSIDLAYNSGK